jgi:hypothetical protein
VSIRRPSSASAPPSAWCPSVAPAHAGSAPDQAVVPHVAYHVQISRTGNWVIEGAAPLPGPNNVQELYLA